MPKIDMSAAAITTRLKRVSQLRRLCLSLQTAKVNGRQERGTETSERGKESPAKTDRPKTK